MPLVRPNLLGNKSMINTVSGFFNGGNSSKDVSEEDKEAFKTGMSELSRQTKNMQELLSDNSTELEKLAKIGDEQAKHLLTQINSLSSLQTSIEKAASGTIENEQQANLIKEQIQSSSNLINELSSDLTVSFGSLFSQLRNTVSDGNTSAEFRQKALADFSSQLIKETSEGNDLTEAQLEASKKTMSILDGFKDSGMPLNMESQATFDSIEQILKTSRLGDRKQINSLAEMNNKFDFAVLSSQNVEGLMAKLTKQGAAFGDQFSNLAKSSLGASLVKGAAGFGLGAIGLGGLEDELVGLSGFLTKIPVKALLKGLGAAGLIATATFGAIKGIEQAATLAGIKPGDEVSANIKLQAGVSGAVSALTVGLASTEDVYQGLEDITGFFTEVGDALTGKTGLSQVISDMSFGSLDTGSIQEGIDGITNFFKEMDSHTKGLVNIFGNKDRTDLDPTKGFFENMFSLRDPHGKITTKAPGLPTSSDGQKMAASIKKEKELNETSKEQQSGMLQLLSIIGISVDKPQTTPDRTTRIDDFELEY